MRTAENHIIDLLPARDRRALLSIADTVELSRSEVLGKVGKSIKYLYFPVDGFVSILTAINGHPVVEVGMIGREGLIGAHVALHILTQPLHVLVQGAGRAWRVPVAAVQKALKTSVPLQRLMERYVFVQITQQARSAGCAYRHPIEARLGRWLLMMHDRARADTFYVTHEFLAYMLGVRRVSITIAANSLLKQGAIRYTRGKLTVLRRRNLEVAACRCYRDDNRTYTNVIGRRL